MKSLDKINAKLHFLYRQNEFLNPKLCRLLCISLIQPPFGYACISWYRLLKINISFFALNLKSNLSQKSISIMGSYIWNILSNDL